MERYKGRKVRYESLTSDRKVRVPVDRCQRPRDAPSSNKERPRHTPAKKYILNRKWAHFFYTFLL